MGRRWVCHLIIRHFYRELIMTVLLRTILVLISGVLLSCTTEQVSKGVGVLLESAGQGAAGPPNSNQVALGLKEALTKGAQVAGSQLSNTDGFLKNQAIKILFPPEFQKVEKTLRSLGMGSLADQAITSFNRAAEKASSRAFPILAQSVKQMTFQDAMDILLGGQSDAATNYLKRTTTNELTKAFLPVVKQSADSVSATKYWGQVASTYNKVPFVKPVPADITKYITDKTLQGLFTMVKKEEANIRANPLARTSGLLKSVFGFADQKRSQGN